MANRSAVLHAPHQLAIEDLPVPEPAAGEVLVRVVAVGICGSDVHYYEHGRIGPYVVDAPMVIGHEAAGIVVGVGPGVSSDRVGEFVALEPGVPCRNCPTCLSGRYNLCPDVVFFATPPVDGAICEYVTLAAAFAHPVPTGLDHDQAAMAEPVSVGIWACRRSDARVGDRVLVTGAGPIGLLTAQVARAFGARSVTVTDMNPFRVEIAGRLG
ncbi:MAG TPA: alcohol dehydrogenase catalytic domain-containing protein, partial [Microlunatus sp.]